VSVPIYPTRTRPTVAYILSTRSCKGPVRGKLDDWDMMKPGVPETMQLAFRFPSSPPTDCDWNDIISPTRPMEGEVEARSGELATFGV